MKRRGRVASHGSVVAASEPPVDKCDDARANDRKETFGNEGEVVHIPPPAPTFSLFARFQQRNNDFSGDWMMIEEAQTPLVSPISHELTQKLRQHQSVLRKRGGAASDSANGDNNNNNKDHDDDDDGGITATATTDTPLGGHVGVESEEEEYTSRESYAQARHRQQEHRSSGSGVDDTSEGMQGDYLSFLPTRDAKDEVAKCDLQATLTVQGGSDGMRLLKTSSQGPNSASLPSSAAQQRVVPLWSVERFTTWGGYSSNSLVALHQEICDFVDYLRPSQAEMSMRSLISMEVHAIAKRLWPECEPIVFGSMSTGLLLPLSDLDMSILNVPVPTEEALIALAREISRVGLCHAAYPQLILKTKVPLVKFQHRLSMLDVDISINASDGQRNSAIVSELLRTFPEARPLTVLVKYFLQQRDMHEPYHGGLGSFATTLLVISFLQNHSIYTTHPEERKFSGLGRLLVDFFRNYGMYFNYDRCGVSLLDGGRCFLRTDTCAQTTQGCATGQRLVSRPTQVLIEDPGCRENNAASSLRNFHVITSLFTYAYMALTAVFDAPRDGAQTLSPDSVEIVRRPTLLSRILHVDAPSVKRRQLIATAYEALMQDPEQREKVLAAVTCCNNDTSLFTEASPKGTAVLNGGGSVQTRKRGRRDASSSGTRDSSNSSRASGSRTSRSGTLSNDSSVRVALRGLNE